MALVGKRCLLMFTTETSKSDVEVLATVVGVRDEPSLFNWSRFTTMQDSEQNRRFFLVLFDDGGECVASQTEVLDFIEAHNARFTTASEQCPFLSLVNKMPRILPLSWVDDGGRVVAPQENKDAYELWWRDYSDRQEGKLVEVTVKAM